MTKCICDICGEEVHDTKVVKLPYAFENYKWKKKVYDLCEDCEAEVTHLINDTQLNWLAEHQKDNLSGGGGSSQTGSSNEPGQGGASAGGIE